MASCRRSLLTCVGAAGVEAAPEVNCFETVDELPFGRIIGDPGEASDRIAEARWVKKMQVVASWNDDPKFMPLSIVETVAAWGFDADHERRLSDSAGVLVVGRGVGLPSNECNRYKPAGPPVGGVYYLLRTEGGYTFTIRVPETGDPFEPIVIEHLGLASPIDIDDSVISATTEQAFSQIDASSERYRAATQAEGGGNLRLLAGVAAVLTAATIAFRRRLARRRAQNERSSRA